MISILFHLKLFFNIFLILIPLSKEMFEDLKVIQIPNQQEIVSVIKESNTKMVFFTLNSLGIIDYLNINSNINYEIKTSSLKLLFSTDVTLFSQGIFLAACTEDHILEVISENGNILNSISYETDNFHLNQTNLKCSISYNNNILLISHSIIEGESLNYTLLSFNINDENTITFINISNMNQIIGLFKTNYPYYFFCYLTSIPCCIYKSSQKNLAYSKILSNYEIDTSTENSILVDSDIYNFDDYKIRYIGDDTFISYIFSKSKRQINSTIIKSSLNKGLSFEEGYVVRNNIPDYNTWIGNPFTGKYDFILSINYESSSEQFYFENLHLNEEDKIYNSNGIITYKNNIGCSQIYNIYIGNGKYFIILRGSIEDTTLEYFIYSIPDKYCASNIIKAYSNQKLIYDGAKLFSTFEDNEKIFIYNTTFTLPSITNNKYITINNNEDYGYHTFSVGLEKELDSNHILKLQENDCLINFYICHEKCSYCESDDFEINGIYSNCSSKRCKDLYYYDPNDSTNCILKTHAQEICYETCNTCLTFGTSDEEKCTSCKYNYIFDGVKGSNCIECDYGNNLWTYNASIDSLKCKILENQSNCPSHYNYIINELNECVNSCSSKYKYEYQNKCYSECPEGTQKDRRSNTNKCCPNGYDYYKEGEICCLEGSNYYEEGKRCCNKGYYYNSTGNTCCPNNYIWDSKGVCCPYGYYADSISLKCCPIGQTYNRKDNYCCPKGSSYNEINEKCECDFYYYYDLNNNNSQVCLLKNECYDKNYQYYIENTRECVKFCNETFKFNINNTFTCVEECGDSMYQIRKTFLCSSTCDGMYFPNGFFCDCDHYYKRKSEYEVYCVPEVNTQEIIEKSKTEKELLDNIEENLDQYLDNGEIINARNMSITVINSSNSDIDFNAGTNLSSIYLGECEKQLKEYYNLPQDEPLIIFQIDISTSNIANKVEYKVYDQLFNQLDLNICEKSLISVYYATNENADISLVESLSSQGLNVFDKKSDFYNSRCISFNQNGNDITIQDRKDDIYYNLSVCESLCTFIGYNNETKRVKCDCQVKKEINTEEVIEKEEATNFFDSINDQINYKLVLCYKVFKKILHEYINNIGFWFTFSCFIIFLVCHLYYFCVGKTVLNSKIKEAFKKPVIEKHVKFDKNPSSPPQKGILRKINSNNNNNNNNNNTTNNNNDFISQLNSTANLNNENNNDNKVNQIGKLLLKNNSITSKNLSPIAKNNIDFTNLEKLFVEENYIKDLSFSNDLENTIEIKNNKLNKTFQNTNPKNVLDLNKSKNEEFLFERGKKRHITITVSKQDPITKLKELNITIDEPSLLIHNEKEKNHNSILKIINMNKPKDKKSSKNVLFDSKIQKGKMKHKKSSEMNNLINDESNQSNNLVSPSFKSKYKRPGDNISITAIQENKPEPSFIKISSNRRLESDLFNTDFPFKEEEEDFHLRQIKIYSKYVKVYLKKDDEHNYYEMTYLQALEYDQRNFFRIFTGIFFIKIELISTLFFPEPFNLYSMTIPLYILSLLIDFTLNSLVYTDEIVSQKYKNEGKLAFITSFILGGIANFITFLIMKIIRKFLNYSFAFEHISISIKNELKYYKSVKRILKIVKKRFCYYFFIELISLSCCGYYLYIFCNIYKKSQFSLVINYFMGLAESLLISLIITFFVTLLRAISLKVKSKGTYYSSRYLSELI